MATRLTGALCFAGACLALLANPVPVRADWREHPELPDWAQRGVVQWGHGANINGRIKWRPGGFGVDVPNARLILACGRTVQQTIAYLDPEAERIAREGGLRRQPYICSQTVWWRSEETATPELKQAVRLGLDGEPIIIYSNPDRHCGCYNAPFWLEYTKAKIDRTLQDGGGHVDSIFFDNPLPYDCYCRFCRDKFALFSKEAYGEEMDLARPESHPNQRFARQLFQAASALEFFEAVKAYMKSLDPTLALSPNMGVGSATSTFLTSRGATEMVFCEEGFTMPPWDSTVLYYKLGLAASHGLATGQLLGLPEMQRRARALALDASNEAGILESLTYPEEHMLAAAEALACDGTYIESFALREQKITADDQPHHVAVNEALTRYAQFEKANHDLYALAQPGSSVAVLNSIWTELANSGARHAFRAACETLGRAGIPYEVLIEEDLKPQALASCRLLILPSVRSLSAEDAAAVLEFIRGGGAVVQTGEVTVADRLNRTYPPESRPELAGLPAGDPQSVGAGRFWHPDQPLDKLPLAQLPELLERVAGPLDCRVTSASPRLFANMLKSRDGKTRSIHLVNSDVTFDELPSSDIRDDSGWPKSRTFFARTDTLARKTLLVPDPAAVDNAAVRFFGNACWAATDKFSLVVWLNGQEIAALKGSSLLEARWYEAAIPAGLLRQENEVIFRAIGEPNSHPDWFALKIDNDAGSRRSSWSEDGGKTWTEEDLSPDSGIQTGEFLVRVGPPTDPDAVAKPEDFAGKCHVHPATDVRVTVRMTGAPQVARLVSPDAPEQRITPDVGDGSATYRISQVSIYSVLVLPQGE